MQLTTIDFRGDQLIAVETDDGYFVAVRPIVEALGMDWSAQYRRIRRDAILSEGVAIMAIPSNGGPQEVLCLPLELISGWLFTIDDQRIEDDEVRAKVLAYKRDCHRVLADHFLRQNPEGPLPPAPIESAERRMLVNEARLTFNQQAARELWFRLGLPLTPSMEQHTQQLHLVAIVSGEVIR